MRVSIFTARVGNHRDARIAHAVHVRHMDYVEGLIEDMLEGGCDITPAMNALLPDGWVWLGAGQYRSTYLSPNGVVYKVNRYAYDDGSGMGNVGEMKNIQHLCDNLPEGFAVPAATMYRVHSNSRNSSVDHVLAMEAVDTSTPFTNCYGDDCYAEGCAFNEGNKRMGVECSFVALQPLFNVMTDVHAGNVFADSLGTMWVVDAAS